MSKLNLAIEFATHKFQAVNTENHFMRVYKILADDFNIKDENILIAGILHDTLEDTETNEKEISEIFNEEVLTMVLEVSHPKDWQDKARPEKSKQDLKNEYYEKIKDISSGAKLIKLADFTDHLKDFIVIYKKHEQHLYPKFINNNLYVAQIRDFLNFCPNSAGKTFCGKLNDELESFL